MKVGGSWSCLTSTLGVAMLLRLDGVCRYSWPQAITSFFHTLTASLSHRKTWPPPPPPHTSQPVRHTRQPATMATYSNTLPAAQ